MDVPKVEAKVGGILTPLGRRSGERGERVREVRG